MKRTTLTVLASTAGMIALAQSPVPPAPLLPPPVSTVAAPATSNAPVRPPPAAATNATSGMPDQNKLRELYAEFSTLMKELAPQEEKLSADAEVRALAEKRDAAMRSVKELDEQRRDLVDKKLSEDPKLAPLVAKRRELKKQLSEIAQSLGGRPNGMMPPPGGGLHPPLMKPLRQPPAMDPVAPAPVPPPPPPAK
jgi:hypothetical protein